ncbi:MAG: uroporphyrinogen decarboxylase family protein [Dehalobacterium sp.]
MSKIVDFHCTYDNSAGVSKDAVKNTDLKFPEAYQRWDLMAQLALVMKEFEHATFCELPFCHTLEGEALGGSINYGDENCGPRVKDYICTMAEEILSLPEIDYTKGRIAEVLKACKFLREKGEDVVLEISGPFTILNVLIDPRVIFKILRKDPDSMKEIFAKLHKEILCFVEEGLRAGANMISYADAAGGLNILGPKLSEHVVEVFTYPLLKEMEKILRDDAIILLCPKTTFALLGIDRAIWKDIDLAKPVKFSEGCAKIIGQAKFAGQMCIKNKDYRLESGIIKTVELL